MIYFNSHNMEEVTFVHFGSSGYLTGTHVVKKSWKEKIPRPPNPEQCLRPRRSASQRIGRSQAHKTFGPCPSPASTIIILCTTITSQTCDRITKQCHETRESTSTLSCYRLQLEYDTPSNQNRYSAHAYDSIAQRRAYYHSN